MQQFDIAVIGGGLVGASFARAISGSGLRTVLIDKTPAAALYDAALDNRGLAIAYTTQQSLHHFKLWTGLSANSHSIAHVHVSEQGKFGFTKLSAQTCGLPALGYVISASHLGAALVRDLHSLPDITVLQPATVSSATYIPESCTWDMTLNDRTISAKLLVAADGTNSLVRKLQNIPLGFKNFDQSAIVCNVHISGQHFDIAYERFFNAGVLAMLPFGKRRLKCIWTTPDARKDELLAMQDEEFLKCLQQAMGFRLGSMLRVEDRKSFPITYAYADNVYGQSAVLIGNAANTLHPVAAQGFNLGMRDAITLAEVLRSARLIGAPINAVQTLQNYAALRAADHQTSRELSNNLVEIFADNKPVTRVLRSFGLVSAQFIPGIKTKIINAGLGAWM